MPTNKILAAFVQERDSRNHFPLQNVGQMWSKLMSNTKPDLHRVNHYANQLHPNTGMSPETNSNDIKSYIGQRSQWEIPSKVMIASIIVQNWTIIASLVEG